jgi:hypothetical protein
VYVAARLGGRTAAVIAFVLTVVPLLLVSVFLWTLTENLTAFALTVAVAALVLVVPARPRAGAALVGCALAVAALAHPGWQLFALVGVLLLRRVREIAIGLAAMVALTLAVVVPMHLAYPGQPWTYGHGNKGYGGGSAWTFYVGTNVETGGAATAADYAAAAERTHPDGYYWRAGLHNIRRDPIDSIGLWFAKAWRTWTAADHYPTRSSRWDRLIGDFEPLGGATLLILGLLAAIAIRGPTVALAAPLVYATVVFATLTTGEVRYAIAAMPAAAAAASLLLVRLPSLRAPPDAAGENEPDAAEREPE